MSVKKRRVFPIGLSKAAQGASPASKALSPEEEFMTKESCRLIYEKAASMYKNEDHILRMVVTLAVLGCPAFCLVIKWADYI